MFIDGMEHWRGAASQEHPLPGQMSALPAELVRAPAVVPLSLANTS